MNSNKIVNPAIYLSIICFLLTYIISILSEDISFSIDSIILLHTNHFIFYVIDVLFLIILPTYLFIQNFRITKFAHTYDNLLQKNQEQLELNVKLTKELLADNLTSAVFIDENDILGTHLMQLRDRLSQNKIDDQSRKVEDQRRSWTTEGQSKFAELLRTNNSNLDDLSYTVISNLVKYLNANQGGFFVLQKDENQSNQEGKFVMTACYAYENKRIRTKTIAWGEGLVGRCAIEKDIIFMTDIPEDYITITSGLGNDTPRCLLLVPLVNNDKILGVMEIASFKVLIEYHIEFIKKIAEVVAATISGVKINIKTADLLRGSQIQGLRLKKQEEEMRQNMEEMRMLQKEAAKQSEEFVSFSNSVNHTMIRADYDVHGTLIYANTKFLSKLDYVSNSEVEGQNILKFIHEKDHPWFENIWENLSKGGQHYEGFMKLLSKNRNDVWTLSTYTCVKNEHGDVNKILFLAIDTTESKKQSLSFEGVISALNRSSLKAEFDLSGNIIDCNSNYVSHLEYQLDELKKQTIFDIVDKSENDKITKIWSTIKTIPSDELLKYNTKENKSKWFFGTFSPVKDMYGDVDKIIFVGSDNTQHELTSQKAETQNKILLEQEAKLQENQQLLEKRLDDAKLEMLNQFKEVEKMKILNEKTLEGALDGIFSFDESGKIIFFNNACEEIWGYKKEEVIGKQLQMLFAEETLKSDPFIENMVLAGSNKVVGVRQEISIYDRNKELKSVLILLSEAKYENDHTYTAFIQKIEIELF